MSLSSANTYMTYEGSGMVPSILPKSNKKKGVKKQPLRMSDEEFGQSLRVNAKLPPISRPLPRSVE
jgi:hypothetical protein